MLEASNTLIQLTIVFLSTPICLAKLSYINSSPVKEAEGIPLSQFVFYVNNISYIFVYVCRYIIRIKAICI